MADVRDGRRFQAIAATLQVAVRDYRGSSEFWDMVQSILLDAAPDHVKQKHLNLDKGGFKFNLGDVVGMKVVAALDKRAIPAPYHIQRRDLAEIEGGIRKTYLVRSFIPEILGLGPGTHIWRPGGFVELREDEIDLFNVLYPDSEHHVEDEDVDGESDDDERQHADLTDTSKN